MKTQGYIFSQAQSEKHEKSQGFREIESFGISS